MIWDVMFFALSKLLWFVVHPGNLLFLGLLLAAVLSFTKWQVASRRIFQLCMLVALIVAVVPFGTILRHQLENRFPQDQPLPAAVDGIVILGGVLSPSLSAHRGAPQFGTAVERIVEGAALARRFPAAKVVFSGGSGDLFDPESREAHHVASVFQALGIAPERVIFEDRARNTRENAVYAKDAAQPGADEAWILVTSAFHMPRAMGVFRKAGWRPIPYPVDYSTRKSYSPSLTFNLFGGFSGLASGLHEFIGLTAYWFKGYTDAWYPAPTT